MLPREASEQGNGLAPRFVTADMRTLTGIDDDSADVVILNNSFIYLPTRADVRKALCTIARVPALSGRVLFFHANRLVGREPLTRGPLVHLRPPRLAEATGRKHSHGRVRLVSPDSLRLMLLRAGFRSPRVGGWVEGKVNTRLKGRLATFYGAGARPP